MPWARNRVWPPACVERHGTEVHARHRQNQARVETTFAEPNTEFTLWPNAALAAPPNGEAPNPAALPNPATPGVYSTMAEEGRAQYR